MREIPDAIAGELGPIILRNSSDAERALKAFQARDNQRLLDEQLHLERRLGGSLQSRKQEQQMLSRRSLLAGAGAMGLGVLGVGLPRPSWALQTAQGMQGGMQGGMVQGGMAQSPTSGAGLDFWQVPRMLSLRHQNGDRIEAVYWANGQFVPGGYEGLSHFMRDRHTGEAVAMDPVVLDIVYGLQGWLRYYGINAGIQINSGYRTPWRNARIEGAAKNSQHTKGRALDVRIGGINTNQVGQFGRWLGAGGVGFYPGKNFTHLDTGRVRTWRG